MGFRNDTTDISYRRKFGGKYYYWKRNTRKKRNAKKLAKYYRKKGMLARVVKVKKGYYAIYVARSH